MRNLTWEFGFLPKPITLTFNGWRVEPLDSFDKTLHEWNELANPHGWVLPPIVEQVNIRRAPDGQQVDEPVPNTRQSADLWRLPPSHRLICEDGEAIAQDEGKPGAPYFVVQCLAAIEGCELQLSNWWVSGKKRLKPLGFLYPVGDALRYYLGCGYEWFEKQEDHARKVISSSLFIHTHSESYEFTWERFLWQHTAFEGCYHLAKKVHGMKVPGGCNRFEVFADHFCLCSDPKQFGMFSQIRNDLVHEVTWGAEVPGFGGEGRPWDETVYLSNFTTLALLAVMKIDKKACK